MLLSSCVQVWMDLIRPVVASGHERNKEGKGNCMGSTKRFMVVAAAAIAMLFAIAAPAFAGGYLNWNLVSNIPSPQSSPHSGYLDTTVKCQVCHAVHYAAAGGQVLLNTSVANACNYCHLTTGSGYSQVYNSNPLNYIGLPGQADYATAHNFNNGAGVACTDCHQVHAAASAMTSNAAITTFMLKKISVVTSATSAQIPLSSDDTWSAMAKWCADCHYLKAINGNATSGAAMGIDQYTAYSLNGASHIMTATTNYSNPAATSFVGQVAWQSSGNCFFCHRAGTWSPDMNGPVNNFNSYKQNNPAVGDYNFPHYTVNAANFLESSLASGAAQSGATTQGADGVCLACHRFTNAGNTLGIGISF